MKNLKENETALPQAFLSGALKGCSKKFCKSPSTTSVVNPISQYRKALRDRNFSTTDIFWGI